MCRTSGLPGTINVPAGGADMDVLDVVRHAQPEWTTCSWRPHRGRKPLDDAARQERPHYPATGQSCPAGWRTLHPQLDHYQTLNADVTCSPTGSTGTWNAASGNSAGWQPWDVDLSAFAGKTAEVSISYVSDWATQGLGMFVDDIAVSTGEGTPPSSPASTDGQ